MKHISQLLILISLLAQSTLTAQIHTFQGQITNDTTWADTLHIVGNIEIPQNITLSFEPGTRVEFQGHYCIDCMGSISAIGLPNDSIWFTVNDTTSFSDTATVAGSWGGLHLLNGVGKTTVFEYCHIAYGKAIGAAPWQSTDRKNYGGAIYANQYPQGIRVNHCLWHHNLAKSTGGAIRADTLCPLSIENSVFRNNKVHEDGASISAGYLCDAYINQNIFHHNIAYNRVGYGSGGRGAATCIYDGDNYNRVIISNNFCYNNLAVSGIIYESNRNSLIINNLVVNNNTGVGIQVGHGIGESKVINNTVCNNQLKIIPIPGTCTGIELSSSGNICKNNVVWGNYGDDDIRTFITIGPGPIIDYNSLEEPVVGKARESNTLFDYPEFTNPSPEAGELEDADQYDWSLMDISPAVNAGTPDTTGLLLPAMDFLGNPRFYGGRIDIGAIENQNLEVGISEPNAPEQVIIYPNPSHGTLFINPNETNLDNPQITITDCLGRVVYQQDYVAGKAIQPGLKKGIYLLYFRNGNSGCVKKLIID